MSDTTFPQSFSRYPLLWIAISFCLGIVSASFYDAGLLFPLISVFVFGTLCVIRRQSAFMLVPLLFFSLGLLSYQIAIASVAGNQIKRIYDEGRIQSGEPVEIEGVLSSLPEPAYGGIFLVLRAERLTFNRSELVVTGKVRIFLPTDAHGEPDEYYFGYGSRLRILCRLEREEAFRNPGVASRIKLLDQQGIDATASVKSSVLIERLEEEDARSPIAWIYEQRRRLISEFSEHFSPQTAGVMIASLLGDQHFLDRQTSEVFRDGGTFHVLVISGLHITFIGGLVLWIVSRLIRSSFLRFVLPVSFLWAYTFAVGAEVPVVRASIMFTGLLFSTVVHRRGSQLNALGLCVLILLVWRPVDLFSASFQLTVVSVAAIVVCAFPLIEKLRSIGRWMPTAEQPLPPRVSRRLRRLCEFLYWNDTVWEIENARQIWSANLYKSTSAKWKTAHNFRNGLAYVFEGLIVSIIVQVWMLPLLVIYFHRISPVSVFLNLWVGVLLTFESFSAVFSVSIGQASEWLAEPLILLTELLNTLMIWAPAWFSENRRASFRLPAYEGNGAIIYLLFESSVVIAASIIFRWHPFALVPAGPTSRRLLKIASFATPAIGLVIAFHPFSAPQPDGRLKIDFLDVGQGDSALVTFPDGVTMLVDGGGQADYRDEDSDFEPDKRRIGEAVVSEFLWEKGYSRIDYLVATHADADHIQGLIDVARNFYVGEILVGTASVGDPDYTELMRVAEARAIKVSTVSRGNYFTIGGALVQVMNPARERPAQTSSNNSSIVMKVSYGTRTVLLTGDIEREIETELLLGFAGDLRADVVKVPHHGSRTSSTEGFVEQVDARIAVISVGRRSQFGHPHREVVERWLRSGANVVTTGTKGTITISTDGSGLETTTFVP